MQALSKKAIEINNLSKSYKHGQIDHEVLRNINLSINKGEFVSVMGPSGSGKSTLLYLMASLDTPTSGSIKINGKEISCMNDTEKSTMRRKEISVVYQFFNLIPDLSVEENILLPIIIDKKNKKNYAKNVDEILNIVNLLDKKHFTPSKLSGGQQQRVALARALINDPDIILADEPTGNLDSKTSLEILKLLQKINKIKGKTIIMVTHSNEAAAFGNRIINIIDGQIDVDNDFRKGNLII